MIERSINLDEFEPGEPEDKAWFYMEDNGESIDIGQCTDDSKFLSLCGYSGKKSEFPDNFFHVFFNKKEVQIIHNVLTVALEKMQD